MAPTPDPLETVTLKTIMTIKFKEQTSCGVVLLGFIGMVLQLNSNAIGK